MQLQSFFPQDDAGNLLTGGTATVYLKGTETLATGLADAAGNPVANPVPAAASGRIQFRAPMGDYDVLLEAAGFSLQVEASFAEAGDLVTRQELAQGPIITVSSTGGTANAQTAPAPDGFSGYVTGQSILWVPNATNSAADPTLDIGGNGPLTIMRVISPAVSVEAGDIVRGEPVLLRISAGNSMAVIVGLPRSGAWESPALSGNATAPTPNERDESDRIATTAFARRAANRDAAWDWSTNVFPDPEFVDAGSVTLGWWPVNIPIVTANGRRAIETPSSSSAGLSMSPLIDVSEFKSGRISASFLLESKDASENNNALRMRIRFLASDGTTTVAVTDNTGNDIPAEASSGYYTRTITTSEITVPTYVVLAEGIEIPPDAKYIRIGPRWETTAQMRVSRIVVRDGASARWTMDTGPAAETPRVVTVGAGGDYQTINEGLDALGGAGTIIVGHARDYGPEMRIDPAKCRGRVSIIGTLNGSVRPRIILSTTVEGVELVAGESRVYRFSFSEASQTPPHVWLHDVPDADTEIPLGERQPYHDGRLHRLPSTKVNRLSAPSLSDALDAMRLSDSPYCYYDDGWLYVTGPEGADLTDADIRIDAAEGWVSSTVRNTAPSIEVANLEIWYGGANLRAFRSQSLFNFFAIGSRGNVVDWIGKMIFSKLEVCGGASWVGVSGDGLNGHTDGHIEGSWLYAHDNQDDGESAHENSSGSIVDFMCEYNGGAAVAPAYGAAMIYENGLSYRNQRAGLKVAAYQAAGLPEAAGDPGFDTIAIFRNCRSIEDVKGFLDSSGQSGNEGRMRAICENCVVESQTGSGAAFDVYEVSNCRKVGGSGAAKASRTIVRSQGDLVV